MVRRTDLVCAPTGLRVRGWEQMSQQTNKQRHFPWGRRALGKVQDKGLARGGVGALRDYLGKGGGEAMPARYLGPQPMTLQPSGCQLGVILQPPLDNIWYV